MIVGSEALQRADGGAVISLVQQIADKAKVQVRSQSFFFSVLWLWWAGPDLSTRVVVPRLFQCRSDMDPVPLNKNFFCQFELIIFYLVYFTLLVFCFDIPRYSA